jgi:PAS domain S-box-containing protein
MMKRTVRPSESSLSPGANRLRGQAEARIRRQPAMSEEVMDLPKTDLDFRRQFHELQVHQVELEMQNAELQEARNRMEALLEKCQAVQEVQERLAAIVASSDDAIVGEDLNGVIISWNIGAEHIFGFSAAEMVGTSTLRLIPAERRDEEKLILGRIRAGRSVKHFETQRIPKRGERIDVSITASPIRNTAGDILGVSKVARDISERKGAEETLRRSEALFGAIIRQAPMGVYVVDARFRLRQMNPLARAVFSTLRKPIGRDLAEIQHILWSKRVADQVVKHFRHTLKTGQPYQSSEFAQRRQDTGADEIYAWQLQRVTLPAGELGVICYFTDITDRRHAEDARRQLEVVSSSNRKLVKEIHRREVGEKALLKSERHQIDLLARSQRMQERLRHLSRQVLQAQEEERRRVSRELHDVIAQTLTGINIRLANFKKAAGLGNKHFERQFARMHQMVEESVAVVQRFARDLRPAVLDDLGLIAALHSHLQNFTNRTGVRTQLTASATVERLDAHRRTVLFRVAQEALTNVARHARASRVEVTLQKGPRHVRMTIVDDGRSFSVERALHVGGRKRLGLLGMRERLEMMGGQFGIESTPGKGTTLTADIPLARTQRGIRRKIGKGRRSPTGKTVRLKTELPESDEGEPLLSPLAPLITDHELKL